jgi:hypothetical protein
MRERIVSEIRRVHAETGVVPGMKTFENATGIAQREWSGKIWARWSDALSEAGLQPNTLTAKTSTEFILAAVGKATIKLQKFPTHRDLNVLWRGAEDVPSVTTVKAHFPRWALLANALRDWASVPDNVQYIGILKFVSESVERPLSSQTAPAYGHVYLLRAGENYKIGQSSDLEKRVKSINVALPDKATLEHAISTDDPSGIEAYWHRRFADRRMNGEWFKLSRADVLAFKKRKFQ